MNRRYTDINTKYKFHEIKIQANNKQNEIKAKGNGEIPSEPGKFDHLASINHRDEHDYHGVPTSLKEQIQEILDMGKALELQAIDAQKKEQLNTSNLNTLSQNPSINNNLAKTPSVIDTVKETASIFKIPKPGNLPTLKPK